MKTVFIAGTDTGVGKSIVTGLLARSLTDSGKTVATQKWVETGSAGFPKDIDVHLKIMKKKRNDYSRYLEVISPYILKFPSSPHLAGRFEKINIKTSRIKKSLKVLETDFDHVLVEGSGGLLVPLNNKTLLIDLVKELRIPVLLVAGNRLGAINHTLLSIEALKTRGINFIGVIFNDISDNADRRILADNPEIIKNFSDINILGRLPYCKNMDTLYRKFKLFYAKLD